MRRRLCEVPASRLSAGRFPPRHALRGRTNGVRRDSLLLLAPWLAVCTAPHTSPPPPAFSGDYSSGDYSSGDSPPPMSPGDCMVVAALSSSPDAFSIVLLSTLGKGQNISGTDMGWEPEAEAFYSYSSETFSVVHTASDDEPPGTVLTQANFSGGALNLGTRDQLLIYQGAEDSPTFLCALDYSGYDWRTTDWSSSTYYSGLPRGLTSGRGALSTKALGWSSSYYYNWAYKGTASADIDGLRTASATGSNWQYSDTRSYVASYVQTSFTVLPPPPAPPAPPSPSPPPPSPPPPLSCGPGTVENAESSQCEIVCPNAQTESESESGSGSGSGDVEPGSGTHRRTLEDSDAAKAIFEIYTSFLLRHPNAADDFWQMHRELSEHDQDFRQPTSA